MNPPQVYTCFPSWTPLPPPSPYHPSGSSQCTSPEHHVSYIKPGLEIHFTYDNVHVSMSLSQIIPPSSSPTESKRLLYTSVSFAVSYCSLEGIFLCESVSIQTMQPTLLVRDLNSIWMKLTFFVRLRWQLWSWRGGTRDDRGKSTVGCEAGLLLCSLPSTAQWGLNSSWWSRSPECLAWTGASLWCSNYCPESGQLLECCLSKNK